jgi:hypothetical protein
VLIGPLRSKGLFILLNLVILDMQRRQKLLTLTRKQQNLMLRYAQKHPQHFHFLAVHRIEHIRCHTRKHHFKAITHRQYANLHPNAVPDFGL